MLMARVVCILACWLGCCGIATAATTVRLPAGVCAADDAIFWNDFETVPLVPTDPSLGSGGATGNVTVTIHVDGADHTYYLRVPASYTPAQAVPLVIALHGAGGPGTADTQAQATRNNWATVANPQGFIVAAPAASGTQQGSWVPNPDYDVIEAVLAAVEADYNIDRTRVYLWGFSAGGYVAWDLVFNHAPSYPTPLSTENLAGMAVSAGVMDGFACGSPQGCDALAANLDRRLPIDIHIGVNDTLRLGLAQADRNRLLANGWRLGTTLGYHEFTDGNPAGGHTYTVGHLAEAWADLCRFARGL